MYSSFSTQSLLADRSFAATGIFAASAKRSVLCAVLACLCVPGTSVAAQPEGVDAFLSEYYADFNGRKIQRLSSEYFHPGAQAVFGEHVTVLANDGDLKGMFSAILGGLEKRGYHRSVVREVSKTRLGDHYVLASVLIDRIKADGKKMDTVCSAYSMVKVRQGWRILSWIPTEPLPNGRCAESVAGG